MRGQGPSIPLLGRSAMSKQGAVCKNSKLCPEGAGALSPGFHIRLCSPGKPHSSLGLSPHGAERGSRLLLLSNEWTLLLSLLSNPWGRKSQIGIWGVSGRGGARVSMMTLQVFNRVLETSKI